MLLQSKPKPKRHTAPLRFRVWLVCQEKGSPLLKEARCWSDIGRKAPRSPSELTFACEPIYLGCYCLQYYGGASLSELAKATGLSTFFPEKQTIDTRRSSINQIYVMCWLQGVRRMLLL